MAKLNAYFQFDFDQLNLNRFVENMESFRLDEDVYEPWQDRFTIFTADEAIVLHGNGFAYDAQANMYQGTVEAFSQWFYDDYAFSWNEAFLLSELDVPTLDIYNAEQSASTDDDFALLEGMLSGDDMFVMSAFDDTVRGFGGDDTFKGRGGDDTMSGDEGADVLQGGDGEDRLFGGAGKDSLLGGADDDILRGGENGDLLRGGKGDDDLYGGSGRDTLLGGAGDDTMRGGLGEDKLLGGADDDVLHGGKGDDVLRGGAGEDELYGGKQDDILRGGAGEDELHGGAGEDLFKFKTGDGVDIIKDFETSFLDHDQISLKGLDSITSWQDLTQNHMEQVGGDVVIDGGDGDMLILEDTSMNALVKVFFEF